MVTSPEDGHLSPEIPREHQVHPNALRVLEIANQYGLLDQELGLYPSEILAALSGIATAAIQDLRTIHLKKKSPDKKDPQAGIPMSERGVRKRLTLALRALATNPDVAEALGEDATPLSLTELTKLTIGFAQNELDHKAEARPTRRGSSTQDTVDGHPAQDVELEETDEDSLDIDEDSLPIIDAVQWRRDRHTSAPEDTAENLEDPVGAYLREIGRIPLLSANQEVSLAKRMVRGKDERRKPRDQQSLRILSDAEEARRKFTEANLRLVVSWARKYVGRGLSLEDIIQEGNLGLMHAVEKYDYTKGYKFSTYASWWIRQAITRAIADKARTIRVPVHMVETINRYIITSRQLFQELGREPTVAELAEAMGKTPEAIQEIIRASQGQPGSLNAHIMDDEEDELGDFVADENAVDPQDAAYSAIQRSELEAALDTLTEREQLVMRLRFGFDDGVGRTLEEVGREFNITRERVRQIEERALRKLRHPKTARTLRRYY